MQIRQTILSLFLIFNIAQALPISATAPVTDIDKRANTKGGGGENINIQKQEKQDAKAVGKAEKGTTAQFDKAKGTLLNTIDDGEKVREKNQKNADKNNKGLVAGLDKVQNAQETEQKLAESLTGGNSKSDKKTLKTLQSDFSSGIKQNEENEKLAKQGSKGKKGN
ncbi:uncharacterized protein PgNI_00142 [Pyricularia grisea]|uniref:Uncharacterized protein n=1 Tax=Pyricularia grisea TaxID=148305 RepID=A0A6P8BIF7_PYRGI|nr:uncharacterized protein PgNI_00142 [Pyricularia grisea]TLD16671.1 hypothetical protein PgNI_00142 [Pyricularia grisea]